MSRQRITDLDLPELEAALDSLGEPRYRAKQIARWLYLGLVTEWVAMTDQPKELRRRLEERFLLSSLTPLDSVEGDGGLTQKVLFGLEDGAAVESVYMRYPASLRGRERATVCVSTQVGCALGCIFCATGQRGFTRQLSAGEIVEQVLYFARTRSPKGNGRRPAITNVVFMGMGEPLANYDALVRSLRILNAPWGVGLGGRQLTVSTVGLVPQVWRLMQERPRVGLAVSIHATEEDQRSRLMPINERYSLRAVTAISRDYARATGRQVTWEYALIDRLNDSPAQARRLGDLARRAGAHVNVLRLNPTEGSQLRPSPQRRVRAFVHALEETGARCSLREPRGLDIQAGCGQLAGRSPGTA